ncbi:MAG: Holliday junction branch migration protein RuvA [Anaerolineae bacterium]|nr:Holliday junction branch migration protein RuvA [Thermoflexales bacterium]MDW8408046.1 Holliday junction branch migration protein RuvA [Anaerolineae bacterium]
MIARLRGAVLSIKQPNVVVDVGGVGYRVTCSQSALDRLEVGRPADIHTHLIVREDGWHLFGFSGEDELELFQTLLTVSGIGPRTALSILSKLPPATFRAAIAQQQVDVVSRVPGVGKKTAEKIIFALKDKLGGLDATAEPSFTAADAEVLSALTSLGYSVAEAQAALASLPRNEPMDLEEKIRRALAYFR